MSKGEFDGKVVLVTGAASGLGRASSIRFATEGAKLCLVDLNADGLAETARRIARQRATPEGRDGIAAFLDKRPPAWLAPKLV